MTARYAQIHDHTIRDAFERYSAQRVNTSGEHLDHDPDALTADAEWVNADRRGRPAARAAARHHAAVTRAHAAIATLDRAGVALTFTAVAKAAGVSRGWLYGQPDLRDAIVRCRRNHSTQAPAIPVSQRATPDSLRQRLDDVQDEITRLRAENAALRDRLARRLGEERSRR